MRLSSLLDSIFLLLSVILPENVLGLRRRVKGFCFSPLPVWACSLRLWPASLAQKNWKNTHPALSALVKSTKLPIIAGCGILWLVAVVRQCFAIFNKVKCKNGLG